MTKSEIKELVAKLFSVKVKGVRTLKVGGEVKSTFSRRKKIVKPIKKAVVWLAGKDKIDLWESGKGKKKS